MAYKTLYRLYRPQTFDEVVGQKYVIQTLKNSIKSNSVSHAYLFCGPRGTGKTTIAKLLAKALNCESEDKPCGKCLTCNAIKDGTYPDVIEMDAASNNGVDEVRDLIDKIKYAPVNGKYKVYIIDEVHMMSTSAFNALLKTLEEPPAHVVFILATTDPQKVLPTIISRCQRFDFTSISKQEIIDHLSHVLNNEGISYDVDVLPLIASLCDGGMRDALGILDQTIAYAGNNIKLHHVEEIYGVLSIKEAIKFVNNILENDYQTVLNDIKNFDKKGIDIPRFTLDLIDIFKDVVIYNKTRNTSLLNKLDEDEINELNMMTSKKALMFIDELIDAINHYKMVKSPISYFEVVILKLCNILDDDKEIINVVKEEKINVSPIKEEKTNVSPIKEEIKEEVKKVEEKPIEIKKQVVDENTFISLTMDDLLNILCQSNKQYKMKMLEKWSTLNKYMLQPRYQKAVNLLIEANVASVAHDGMLLVFDTKMKADLVNNARNQNIIVQFFNDEFIGRPFYFYALSNEEFDKLKFEFITRKQNNTLPKIHKITPQTVKKEEINVEDNNLNKLKSIFGDTLEIIE